MSGFAIWKISEPEKTSRNFDFVNVGQAIQLIAVNLKDVVESAIRHQVANMTIEAVLRKRGSIILQLKEELAYIADQWGLTIETIEIKNVRIMSAQLFTNMQAKYRDKVRLVSEASGLETEREIAERRFAQREQLALKEQEFKRREGERKAELAVMAAQSEAEFELLKDRQLKAFQTANIANEAELHALRQANREEELRLEEKLNAVARGAQKERLLLETERRQHEATLAALNDQMQRARIETANLAKPDLALIEKLPAALGALKVSELNLGDNLLARVADAARVAFGNGGKA